MLDHSGGVAFRAPLLPFATVGDLTGGAARAAWLAGGDVDAAVAADREHLDAAVARLLETPVVRAGIALASPDLDDALSRSSRSSRVPLGAVAYVLRMAGRPAPFGLFAGCAGGSVAGEPAYALGSAPRVRARLGLAAAERLAGGAVLVPNSTLYTAGGRLRLVERVVAGEAARYAPLAVEDDEALRAVLSAASGGATREELARVLAGDDVTEEEAAAFVGELVAAQLLVPDVPVVTGTGPRLDELAALEDAPSPETVRAAVAAVTSRVGVPRGRAVSVDMARPGTFVLGDAVLAEARRAVEVLHTLHRETALDGDLASFAEAYAARWGDAETPLLEVLDPEHGIGFGDGPGLAVHGAPLLRGFSPVPPVEGAPWTPIDHHLVDLLSRALRDGADEIELPAHEVHSLRNQRPRPLPPSLALVATIAARSAEAVAAGEFRLVAHGASGPDAVAAFSRFAPLDESLDALVRRHVREEQERTDALLAEVVHLPERRSGDVAARPSVRDAEIPVLAAAGAARRVALGDLMVSLHGGRVVLRDGDGRRVLPRLSAPHEVLASGLPLYRFLVAAGRDGLAHTMRWSWGSVASAPFLPRVSYGRLVLSRAQWWWFRRELADLRAARTAAARYDAVQRLREAWRVPRWVALARGESELPLDLDGVAAADLLARAARSFGQLTVRELLPAPGELCLTGPGGAYAHEVVVPFHGPPVAAMPRRERAYVSAGDWLAATVECSPATADAVLREVVPRVVAGAEEWWDDRAPALRLRARGDVPALLAALREGLRPYAVADVRVETFRPSAADAVAHADSVAALRLLGDDLDARWRAAFWSLDGLVSDAALFRRWRDRLANELGENGARALRHAGRVHRARRRDLREPDAAVAAVLAERERMVGERLRGAPEDVLEAVCAASVSRLLRAAHDVQRVVLYDLLARRYR